MAIKPKAKIPNIRKPKKALTHKATIENTSRRLGFFTNETERTKPDITKPYIVSGDTRYEVAKELLAGYDKDFSVNDAFKVLKSVSQKDLWATRVSFVYSTEKNKVYYVLNNDFSNVFEFQF